MIEMTDISKSYKTKTGCVNALRGVSLKVDRSDIYGIVGYSGAGKSTLLRCINLLEHPDSGRVLIEGREITELAPKDIEKTRQGIGMIFQHFNLLRSRTVYENIAFPLRFLRKSRKEIDERVSELIDLVDLGDKVDSYPSQLSGGQKQRVAIARALANNPHILLSDEATSALDPQTTDSILRLLMELNHKLNLTIVIVTHELHVVKEICNKVAVMEDGLIVERGDSYEVFSSPKAELTKNFMASLFKVNAIEKLMTRLDRSRIFKPGGKLIHLMFTGETGYEAYISRVIKEFDVEVSVLYGSIEEIQSYLIGSLFVTFHGEEKRITNALGFLKNEGVGVNVLHEESEERRIPA